MKWCSKCVTPETHEVITFDKKGVCSVCRQIEYKQTQIDWVARRKEFEELLNEYRGKYDYDCIIPFSGGKDSTFQAYTLVRDFKLKPLIVSFDHGFYRPRHLRNVEKTIKKLGVDFLKFRPNWQIVKKLMLESLKRKGDFCWHCHTGIYSYPMQIAVKFKIPLIIWGESVAEYSSFYSFKEKEELNEERFNKCCNLGINAEDILGMLNDKSIAARDLAPFTYPKMEDLQAIKFRSICLGSYMPWDVRKQSEIIARELDWEGDDKEGVPPEYYYEKVECAFQGIRDYLKFIKRGYGRTSHLTSIDIRNDRMSRETAEKLMKDYDGKRPASLDIFLKVLRITEEEFNEIATAQAVYPYVHDFKNNIIGPKLHDQDEWHIDD